MRIREPMLSSSKSSSLTQVCDNLRSMVINIAHSTFIDYYNGILLKQVMAEIPSSSAIAIVGAFQTFSMKSTHQSVKIYVRLWG